jgi:hypothetical protein
MDARRFLLVGVGAILVWAQMGQAAWAQSLPELGRFDSLGYQMTSGTIDVFVRFRGDGSDECIRRGTCGYAGQIHYRLTARRGSSAFFVSAPENEGGPFGAAFLFGSGRTVADVWLADTSNRGFHRCLDSRAHAVDGLLFDRRGRRQVLVRLRSAPGGVFTPGTNFDDYLDTHCAGPTENDLIRAGAYPTRSYAGRRFHRRRFNLALSGVRRFRRSGFRVEVRTRVRVHLRRELSLRFPEGGVF